MLFRVRVEKHVVLSDTTEAHDGKFTGKGLDINTDCDRP